MDGGSNVMSLVDPATGAVVRTVANVVPGSIFLPRNSGRLLVLPAGADPGRRATVIDRRSWEVLGSETVGNDCNSMESADGRRLVLRCSGSLNAIDLESGGVTTSVVPFDSPLLRINDEIGAIVRTDYPAAGGMRAEALIFGLSDASMVARIDLGNDLTASNAVVSRDGRKLFVQVEPSYTRKKDRTPGAVLTIDPAIGKVIHRTTLSGPMGQSRPDQAAGYLYLSNVGEELTRGLSYVLEIFSLEDARVTGRLPLGQVWSWTHWVSGNRESLDGSHVLHTHDEVIVLAAGKAVRIPLVGAGTAPTSACADPRRHRWYIAAGRTLVAVQLPGVEVIQRIPLSSNADGGLRLSPDGRYAILERLDRLTIVDLEKGRETGRVQLSTSGRRAKLFWSDLGASFLVGSVGGGAVDSGIYSRTMAFDAAGETVAMLAMTGEVAFVDLTAGRIRARASEQAAGLLGIPGGRAVALTRSMATVMDVASGNEIHRISLGKARDEPPQVAASADGRWIAFATRDGIQIVDVKERRMVRAAVTVAWPPRLAFLN